MFRNIIFSFSLIIFRNPFGFLIFDYGRDNNYIFCLYVII
ncbi:MAG: hypothetical protein ACI8P3_004095 [Saprospiraceae bacterium]